MTFVYVDLEGESILVGRLWSHQRKGRESASFEYDQNWLSHPNRFSLEPALMLTEGSFHTGADKAMFGAIGDSAPDRWGRVLMRRAAKAKARAEGQTVSTFSEIDYLLGVNDEARQGALRFSREEGATFLATNDSQRIPPLVNLSSLMFSSEKVLDDHESDEDLRILLAPGSSLGGARPKASVRDKEGALMIAKFPYHEDEFIVPAWEAVMLYLAKKCGLSTPEWRLENISSRKVLLVKRFDREGEIRIPFLSAMSMLGAKDNETHSYLEIADAIRQYGASPRGDLKELWKRVVFSILVSNTDDHLRNHGFLYEGQKGWRLSPLYDVNPTPIEVRPHILTTLIDLEEGTASFDLAISVASEFGIDEEEGQKTILEMKEVVSDWRNVARKYDIKQNEIERMSSAFRC